MSALDDADDLDGCDFSEDDVFATDEEVGFLPLFPEGKASAEDADVWRELFDAVSD